MTYNSNLLLGAYFRGCFAKPQNHAFKTLNVENMISVLALVLFQKLSVFLLVHISTPALGTSVNRVDTLAATHTAIYFTQLTRQ